MAKEGAGFAEIEEYTKKLAQNPESLVFVPLAEIYRKQGLWDEAIDVCQKGLKIHPTYMSARVVLGRACMEKSMLAEAQAEFKKVIEIESSNILARGFLANIYMQEGKHKEALEECERVLAINPDNTAIQNLFAEAQNKLGITPNRAKEDGPPEIKAVSETPANPKPEIQPKAVSTPLLKTTVESRSNSFESDHITSDDLLSVMKNVGSLIFDKGDEPEPADLPRKSTTVEETPVAQDAEPLRQEQQQEEEEEEVRPKIAKVTDQGLEIILQGLNQKGGILGSMIVRPTGEIVASALKAGMDEQGAGSAGLTLFRKTSEAVKRMQWGNVGLIIISAEASQMILMETKQGILNVLADISTSFGLLKLALNETVKKINS